MKKDIFAEIYEFVERERITDATFCKMANLSPTWLSKTKKGLSHRVKVETLRTIRDILSGKIPIPEECQKQVAAVRVAEESNDSNLMPLLKNIVYARKESFISYRELVVLINAEHAFVKAGIVRQ